MFVSKLLLFSLISGCLSVSIGYVAATEDDPDTDPVPGTTTTETWVYVTEPQYSKYMHLRNKKTHVCIESLDQNRIKFARCDAAKIGQLWMHRQEEGHLISKRSRNICLKNDRKTAPCSDPLTQYNFETWLIQKRSGKPIKAPDSPSYTGENEYYNSDWEMIDLDSSNTGVTSTSTTSTTTTTTTPRPTKAKTSTTRPNSGGGDTTSTKSEPDNGAGTTISPNKGIGSNTNPKQPDSSIEPTYYSFYNEASDKYLGLSKSNHPILWNGNLWSYWLLWNGQLVSRAHPFDCLTRSQSNDLHVTKCTTKDEWQFDGGLIRNKIAQGQCLQTEDNKHELEDVLVLGSCLDKESKANRNNQIWVMKEVASTDVGTDPSVILHVDSGKCVGLNARSFTLSPCNSTSAQLLWDYNYKTKYLRLIEKGEPTNKCLSRNPGNPVLRVTGCNNGSRWDYDSWQFHHQSGDNFCLDDMYDRHGLGSEIKAHTCQPLESLGQRFKLQDPPMNPPPQEAGLGYQYITDAESTSCLGVNDKKEIQISNCSDANSIRWLYDSHNGFIRSRVDYYWCLGKSGDRLSIDDCGDQGTKRFYDGETIRGLAPSKGVGSGRSWHFEPAPNKDLGVDFFHIKAGGLCAEVSSTNTILMADCGETPSGLWTYEPSSGQLKPKSDPEKCLVRSFTTSKLQLAKCDQTAIWDYDGVQLRLRSRINECADTYFPKPTAGEPLVSVSCWNVVNDILIS